MKPQTLKGFRDFLPQEMSLRLNILAIMRKVFESFGFQPLETPSIEYSSTLLEKYGEEADKLVYTFKDKGDRDVGLIYDLTVPTAKVLSIYQQEITLPFKRYQIQRVWRAEKPQKGRYREFTQCDIDIFGVSSPLADAEIIAVISEVLRKLGIEKFTMNVNSRKILFKILEKVGIIAKNQQFSVLQSIDKLDKKSKEDITTELKSKGLDESLISKLYAAIEGAKLEDDPILSQVLSYAKAQGAENVNFVPYMVRGLNYYTGTIYEALIDGISLGSVAGGGRYDSLVSLLGGPDIPAVGTTFGLDRLVDASRELNIASQNLTNTKVLVTVFNDETIDQSLSVLTELRSADIAAEMYLAPEKKFEKQIKYADRNNIPYLVIIGPEEISKNIVKLKDLKTREQKELSIKELISKLKV